MRSINFFGYARIIGCVVDDDGHHLVVFVVVPSPARINFSSCPRRPSVRLSLLVSSQSPRAFSPCVGYYGYALCIARTAIRLSASTGPPRYNRALLRSWLTTLIFSGEHFSLVVFHQLAPEFPRIAVHRKQLLLRLKEIYQGAGNRVLIYRTRVPRLYVSTILFFQLQNELLFLFFDNTIQESCIYFLEGCKKYNNNKNA